MKANKKEVFTKAGGHFFRAIASMVDAAHAFYEAGYPDEGDATISSVQTMIGDLPEFPE